MKALLIIAHGSRKAESNQETESLTSKLKNKLNDFDLVAHAFLELAKPDIATGINSLIENGAKHIVVLPYFLANGNHVARDIPDEIAIIEQQASDIQIEMLPHIGSSDSIVDLAVQHIAAR